MTLVSFRPLPVLRRRLGALARRLAFSSLCLAVAGAAESRLTNVSVRSAAGSDAATLIVGFAVGGSGEKPVLIRGIGPTLGVFNVPGAAANPRLQLFGRAGAIAQNDDWGGGAPLAAAFQATGAFQLASGSRDAALLQTLQPGPYSAHLTTDTGDGIALVECYDAGRGNDTAYITNLSARSIAGTAASVLTIGFSISGTEPKLLLLRGIGPTLGAFGVDGALADTRLRLFDAAGTEIADNDNWSSAITPQSVFTGAGAFELAATSRDAVLFFALPPGNYTAQVSGIGGTTGPALVEVYEVARTAVPFVTIQPVAETAGGIPDDPGAGTISEGADTGPRATSQARPQYPFELRRASITGSATIDFYVKADGTVANATAIRATDFRFADSAKTAVSAWRFTPGRRNGKLVTTHLQVPIIYTLN